MLRYLLNTGESLMVYGEYMKFNDRNVGHLKCVMQLNLTIYQCYNICLLQVIVLAIKHNRNVLITLYDGLYCMHYIKHIEKYEKNITKVLLISHPPMTTTFKTRL